MVEVSYRKKFLLCQKCFVSSCETLSQAQGGGGCMVINFVKILHYILYKDLIYSDTIYTVKHSQNKKISNTPIGGVGPNSARI